MSEGNSTPKPRPRHAMLASAAKKAAALKEADSSSANPAPKATKVGVTLTTIDVFGPNAFTDAELKSAVEAPTEAEIEERVLEFISKFEVDPFDGPPAPSQERVRAMVIEELTRERAAKIPSLEQRNAKAIAAANPVYDRINKAWERTELHIQKLGLLAPVEFCYDDHREVTWYLGVQKRNGKWKICHGEYDVRDQERWEYEETGYDTQWTPITDCNIELRIAMTKHIGRLLEEVVKTNEKTVPELAKSAEEVEATLKKLGIS